MIHVARAYGDEKSYGKRILVDRIWPQGVSKEKANLDEWFKDVSPSTSLRKWFDHDPEKYDEFKKKYYDEIKDNDEFKQLKEMKDKGAITLIYGAKDEKHNNAVALKEFLDRQ